MKGVIFNLLEEVVVDARGERVWDELLDAAGVSGVYTSLGSYDDAEIMSLVSAAGAPLSMSDREVLRWFGRQAMSILATSRPEFFTPHQHAAPFLRTLNSVIHPEVRKLYPGAYCPHFGFQSPPDGSLLIDYRSPRKLCDLAHGFILGVGDHYGETLNVRHLECMQNGSDRCLMAVDGGAGRD